MKVKCVMRVQIYDDDLRNVYETDQVVEGALAPLLVERYPQFFTPVEAPVRKAKEGVKEANA